MRSSRGTQGREAQTLREVGFLVRFDADTKQMTWSTALTSMDPVDVVADVRQVFVAAHPWGPIEPFLEDEQGYYADIHVQSPGTELVLGFDQGGLFYGSKYGGLGVDEIVAIAHGPLERLYVAGWSENPAYFPNRRSAVCRVPLSRHR